MSDYTYHKPCSKSDSKMNIVAILLVFQCIAQTLVFGTDCSLYKFVNQPPLQLDCNPYQYVDKISHIRIIWRLRLACRVQSDNSNRVSFDVRWFRKTNKAMEDLGQLSRPINEFNDLKVVFGLNILNDDYDESMLGDYWCHVIHNSSSSSSPVYYGRSNVLTIYPPDNYNSSLPICSEITNNLTNICADYPFVPNNTTSTMMNTAGSSSSSITDSQFSITDSTFSSTATSMIITSAIVTNRFTSTTNEHPSAMNGTPSDILSKRTDADLILAASIGGAMFILIILLLVIIAVLLCTKNRKRKQTNSDKEVIMERLSGLRSSQRPLLDSNSLSPDLTLVASYRPTRDSEDNHPSTISHHHYSTIDDSFQPTPDPNLVALERSIVDDIDMTNNPQYYSTAETTNDFITSQSNSHSSDSTNNAVDETAETHSQNEYSSLKLNKPSSASIPIDGYNVLWQQQPQVPQQDMMLAYSTLYAPDTPDTATELSQDVGPYHKLSHVKSNDVTSKGLVDPYETLEIFPQLQPQAHAGQTMFDDPRYSVLVKDDQEKSQEEKITPIIPPNYRGDYERDPNYSANNIN